MAPITGHKLVAQALINEGVDALFFLMGGPIQWFVAEAQQMGIKTYYFRHEQGAAMAAHAYARATGKTGVCATTSGPGTVNAATGLSNAMADASPPPVSGGLALHDHERHGRLPGAGPGADHEAHHQARAEGGPHGPDTGIPERRLSPRPGRVQRARLPGPPGGHSERKRGGGAGAVPHELSDGIAAFGRPRPWCAKPSTCWPGRRSP